MKDSTIFFLKCKHIILIKALDKRSCDFHKLLIGFNWMKVNYIVLIRLLLNPMWHKIIVIWLNWLVAEYSGIS